MPKRVWPASSLLLNDHARCDDAGRMEEHAAGATLEEVIAHRPDVRSTALQRELASIHRSVLGLSRLGAWL